MRRRLFQLNSGFHLHSVRCHSSGSNLFSMNEIIPRITLLCFVARVGGVFQKQRKRSWKGFLKNGMIQRVFFIRVMMVRKNAVELK